MIVVTECIALLCACTGKTDKAALEEYANYFVPADASEIVTAPDLPWIQRSFDVERTPSEFAVSADTLTRAKSDGWTLCEQSDPQWTEYQDATLAPPRYMRQRAYVLHKGSTLVVLVGKYYSDSAFSSDAAATTEKKTQHGMVIVRNASDPEVQETVDSFKLSCG
jgi:hypothetical protein